MPRKAKTMRKGSAGYRPIEVAQGYGRAARLKALRESSGEEGEDEKALTPEDEVREEQMSPNMRGLTPAGRRLLKEAAQYRRVRA